MTEQNHFTLTEPEALALQFLITEASQEISVINDAAGYEVPFIQYFYGAHSSRFSWAQKRYNESFASNITDHNNVLEKPKFALDDLYRVCLNFNKIITLENSGGINFYISKPSEFIKEPALLAVPLRRLSQNKNNILTIAKQIIQALPLLNFRSKIQP